MRVHRRVPASVRPGAGPVPVGPGVLLGAALLRAAAPVAAVLLLLRNGPGTGYALAACAAVWWAARTLDGVLVPRAARAVDHAARRSVLDALARAADARRLDPDDRELADAAHAAAGVAVRWEPKPGTAVGPAARLVRDAVTVSGVCAVLGAAYAPAGWLCAGAAVLAGAVRVRRPARADAAFGRTRWLALARRTRRRPVTARVSALAPALTAFLTAGTRPGLEAGAALAAVLLYRAGAALQDLTALRHGVAALSRVRALRTTAARPRAPRAPAERLTVRPLPGGGLRIRLTQPDPAGHPHATEIDAAPGTSVHLPTTRAATDVLHHLMTTTTGPVLMVPPAPLRLGFATLTDNITLDTRPLPARLVAGLPYGPRTLLSAQYSRGVDLDDDAWSTVTAARLTARLPAGPALICLAASPAPALARALDRARAQGACVLRLDPVPVTAAPEPV
ncbi:hypothetical protein [Streptomyces acidiscabies]|uniref:Uncharacterized protein n=1 Tax=Streptomyces acidiscabies TaxID=42234 RepID=A0A0L0JKP9_9ACTN|nr:hypothetical protein [Streptomyces acidiscabies]KND26271.1 hypothetical protein IQ63_37555 [Streptomyces acidiscabies]